jgi:hypothetical protein
MAFRLQWHTCVANHYRTRRARSAPICRIINFLGKIRCGKSYTWNILQYSFFPSVNFFWKKTILLKFRHSILELFSTNPGLRVRYWWLSYAYSSTMTYVHIYIYISFTLATHVILVLMVLPNFRNHCCIWFLNGMPF